MDFSKLLFVSSALFGIVAYTRYYLDTRKDTIQPNKWSWLIWSVATFVEAFTYDAISEDPFKTWLFFISAGFCIVLTVSLWKKSAWQMPDWTEIVCVVFSLVAIVIWKQFGDAKVAHYTALVALPIAFIPTYQSAWKDFRSENNLSWMLWTIEDLLALVLVVTRLEKSEELPYAVLECLCHGTVWAIVSFRKSTNR